MKQSHKNFAKIIALVVEKDEGGVRKLLERNGVKTQLIIGKQSLINALVDAIKKSQRFAFEFDKYLKYLAANNMLNFAADQRDLNGMNMNFSGGNKTFQELLAESESLRDTMPSVTSTTTTTQPSKGGFLAGVTLEGLLNNAVSIFEIQRDIKVSENTASSIKTAAEIEREKIQGAPTSKSNKTVAVVVVISLLAIGIGTYFILKKKK